MMRTIRRLPLIAVVLGLVLAACGGNGADTGGEGSPAETAAETEAAATPTDTVDTVEFAHAPWPGLTVKTEVATQILEAAGYDTNTSELAVPAAAQAVSQGDMHAWLGQWMPSQEPAWADFMDDGSVTQAAVNLSGTTYIPAVPQYVADDMGITSFADLDEHAEEFGNRFLGIEAGNPGNQYIQDAIDQDAYGLGDWEVVTSSTSAMLTEVGNAIDNQEPVAFLGWKPHWMTVAYDLHFLEDPQDVWPGAGEVHTVLNTEFMENNPNAATFLEQIQVELQTQSDWIFEFGRENRPADEVATEWLSGNLDTVEPWLEGVQARDGGPAIDAVRSEFGSA